MTQEFEPPEGSKVIAPKDFKPKPTFERDYLKKKQIFTDKMPFMNQARSEALGLTAVKFENRQLFKPMNQAMSKMAGELQYGWIDVTPEQGRGKVLAHIYADKDSLKIETHQAFMLSKKGDVIKIHPNIQERFSKNFKDFKNPDTFFKGRLTDFKIQKKGDIESFISKGVRGSNEQGASLSVLQVKELDIDKIAQHVKGALNENINRGVQVVVIQYGKNNYTIRRAYLDADIDRFRKSKAPKEGLL